MMEKVITLKNLNNEYCQIDSDNDQLYYDEINNNLIVFNPIDDDCDIEGICNGITTEPYEYLINVLNNHTDTVVIWSKISGTTSDYTIFYDQISIIPDEHFEDVDKIMKIMYDSITSERKISYKYTEVLNGIESNANINK